MRIALFIHGSHRFLPDIVRLAERLGRVAVMDCDNGGCENLAADHRPDLVLNFITREVFRRFVLNTPNVNFHPACPAYPGIGASSRALFDGVKTFGATAHQMVRTIDAGAIFDVERIPVFDDDSSETLFARAEAACVTLADRITDHVARTRTLPPPCGEQWTGRYMSVRQFHDDWLRMDINDAEEIARKLRAATHSKHPGPYFLIHGRKFVLAKP